MRFDWSSTERVWMAEGSGIGENVVPLARNFGNLSGDVEAEAILRVWL